MTHLRSIALGTLLIAGVVALEAQDVRDTIGQLEKAAQPITPENPLPRRTFGEPVFYPIELRRHGAKGAVIFQVTIDS